MIAIATFAPIDRRRFDVASVEARFSSVPIAIAVTPTP